MGQKDAAKIQLDAGKGALPDRAARQDLLDVAGGKAKKMSRDDDALRPVTDSKALDRELAKKTESIATLTKGKSTKGKSLSEFKKQEADERNEVALKSRTAGVTLDPSMVKLRPN